MFGDKKLVNFELRSPNSEFICRNIFIYKTIIGDNSFIGSNTSLIAPVKIGNNVKIGAGSVINKDISANKLAIRRSKLKIY